MALNMEVELTTIPVDLTVRTTAGHRCAVVFYPRDGRLSAAVSNTDPAYARVGKMGVARTVAGAEVEACRPLDDTPQARVAAQVVNEFTRRSREVLEGHEVNVRRRRAGNLPVNAILLRDAGDHLPTLPQMTERFGVRLGCLVEMPVERGIARVLGLDVVEISSGKSYLSWATKALEAIGRYDGLYVHLKGPDEAGHDGDPTAKIASIERIDAEFFGRLVEAAGNSLWAVTADHATPCELHTHAADPVPLLISGNGADGRGRFTEADAAQGSLGTLQGVDILPILIELAKA